ncbi:cobalt-precorrin-6A reductase [Cyanobacterium aponinum UTEX 3222]|uniref:Cobalt-precorrin-6A reductase n=1 Tax=Cyanobacterium aponinum 0216 TaxID=2676140 RepID=A0A844GUT7_9CHRO|nr:cobalt-precorrin-6A reductase [Cyanobacterium aponinum]MTF38832.1 cobalt-precorrin-6A reductase [Cyanobacterium aponinum 0216]WRL37239.1 cobalt-precorrin-6A reductase [Cyanobacterium aponinum UTEX 3221]WRL43589.1 cobalt-precorrin-6A reductase [Cyanobacterium aponinum UTEX 3222]
MIWLIGGTSESVIIARLLSDLKQDFVVTVTTKSACQLYENINNIQVVVTKLSLAQMRDFISLWQVFAIIDASHPFALEVSQNAIHLVTSSQDLCLPYLRYEREMVTTNNHKNIFYYPDLQSLLSDNWILKQKKVLLTIGAKYLHLFKPYHHQAQFYARILPYQSSLELAEKAGFGCDRIIAIRPPLSLELEKALWQLWDIEIVVTKAGGKAGGEDIKYQLAEELKIPLVVIKRPSLNYPLMAKSVEDVKEFLKNF